MAAVESGSSQASENKNFAGWKLCALPWWQKGSSERRPIVSRNHSKGRPPVQKQQSLVAIAKASLLTRRRLRLDPDGKLFFLYEPGKQVSSAVRIKNISRSFVAFKFQTNAPKSCFMRPPNGILAPNESMVTSVVKFVEQPEHSQEKKTRDKFKIVSLKVKEGVEYTPELFEENKELLAVEKVLRVVFLDPQRPSKELEKLKKRLAEAEATNQARKKPQVVENQTNKKIKVLRTDNGGDFFSREFEKFCKQCGRRMVTSRVWNPHWAAVSIPMEKMQQCWTATMEQSFCSKCLM